MSGFVAIYHRDGGAVDLQQVRSLTAAMEFRGPDGLHHWQQGGIGLGHALFITDPPRNGQRQPVGLGETHWICGDIRLDAREELVAVLAQAGVGLAPGTSDATLVLAAYRAWGTECTVRIQGDFAFAIWDEPRQRLFCARDRFGIKPFFYALFPDFVAVSNTLDCLRQHPRVSSKLYEPALADFLVDGSLLERDRSYFSDIRRLPPAHTMLVTRDVMNIARYWALPVEPELRYRDPREYVEHYTEVLSQSVADRAGTGAISVFMSGGLDSASIAATLLGKLGHAAASGAVKGVCMGWNAVFPDREPHFAKLSATALGLSLDVLEEPDCRPFKLWEQVNGVGPEPTENIYRESSQRCCLHAAGHGRIALDGQGGDEVFLGEMLWDEWRRAPLRQLAADGIKTWVATKRRPPLGVKAALRLAFSGSPQEYATPADWLETSWRRQLMVDERSRTLGASDSASLRLPRGKTRTRLMYPMWGPYLESYDPGFTRLPIEIRWPFLDQRLVRFALRLPPFPWCVNKYLQRRTLAGCLPAEITSRPKSGLGGDPFAAFLAREPNWHSEQGWAESWLSKRVEFATWQRAWKEVGARTRGPEHIWVLVRAVALAHWLRNVSSQNTTGPSVA